MSNQQSNQLQNEKSPYLRQHAQNPVNWYPWGEEAFEKAKKENKPVLVSIGYATCHWCHVMAHETFEDVQVADILNQHFVSIKVDREERPDIDSVYMTVCQMMTGQGGWPLNLFVTPDKEPFFAGTYFPKESSPGRLGFIDLLLRIQDIWENKSLDLKTTVQNVKDALKQAKESTSGNTLNSPKEFTQQLVHELKSLFDSEYGGFGSAPKFPSPHKLDYLLLENYFSKDSNALEVVEKTLSQMHRGAFFDHIGGGVHRYSTDHKWELPHFEKMLYDQAGCALAYVNAYQVTKNIFYKKVAESILNFCVKELKLPTGGYASAYDADSEGEEGKFYIWDYNELKDNLEPFEFEFLQNYFELQEEGNFNDEATGEKVDKNIIFLKKSFFKSSSEQVEKFFEKFEPIKLKLWEIRNKREKPLLDTKVLSDWNSFLAVAFFKAGSILGNVRYIQEAENIIDFLTRNVESEGLLFHRFCEGEVLKTSFLDDQSYFMWALLEAYQVTHKKSYLELLAKVFNKTQSEFSDPQKPGMFLTPKEQEIVVMRTKEIYDGASPSGAAVYYYVSLLYARAIQDVGLTTKIHKDLLEMASDFMYSPSSYCFWAQTLKLMQESYKEIVVMGASTEELKKISKVISEKFLPNLIYHGDNPTKAIHGISAKDEKSNVVNGLKIYLCEEYVCKKPFDNMDEFKAVLSLG